MWREEGEEEERELQAGRSVGRWAKLDNGGKKKEGDKGEKKVRRDFSLPPALGGLARGGAEILLQSSTSYLSGGKSKGFFFSPLAGDNGRRENFSSV